MHIERSENGNISCRQKWKFPSIRNRPWKSIILTLDLSAKPGKKKSPNRKLQHNSCWGIPLDCRYPYQGEPKALRDFFFPFAGRFGPLDFPYFGVISPVLGRRCCKSVANFFRRSIRCGSKHSGLFSPQGSIPAVNESPSPGAHPSPSPPSARSGKAGRNGCRPGASYQSCCVRPGTEFP